MSSFYSSAAHRAVSALHCVLTQYRIHIYASGQESNEEGISQHLTHNCFIDYTHNGRWGICATQDLKSGRQCLQGTERQRLHKNGLYLVANGWASQVICVTQVWCLVTNSKIICKIISTFLATVKLISLQLKAKISCFCDNCWQFNVVLYQVACLQALIPAHGMMFYWIRIVLENKTATWWRYAIIENTSNQAPPKN